jgi:hypothetical protein
MRTLRVSRLFDAVIDIIGEKGSAIAMNNALVRRDIKAANT